MGPKWNPAFNTTYVDGARSFIKDLDAQVIHGLASRASIKTCSSGGNWRLDMQTHISKPIPASNLQVQPNKDEGKSGKKSASSRHANPNHGSIACVIVSDKYLEVDEADMIGDAEKIGNTIRHALLRSLDKTMLQQGDQNKNVVKLWVSSTGVILSSQEEFVKAG